MSLRPYSLSRALSIGMLGLFTLTLAAQESKVRWKVATNFELPPNEGTVFNKVVRGDAGCIVALRVAGSDPVIGGRPQGELDRTLVSYTIEGLTEIKFDKTKILWGEEGHVAIETIERFASSFRVIASKPDPEHGKMLLIQQIQTPRGLTGKGGQLLAEIPFDMLGGNAQAFQQNMAVGFTTTVGVDSTKMLIGLSPESTVRSAGCPVFAMMFDKQMKKLWWNKLTTDGNARRIDVIDTKVDATGAVWYLIKNIISPDATGTGEAQLGYNFTLYKLDSTGQKSAVLDLPGADFAQDAAMDMRPDGSIVVAGVYADDNTNRTEAVGVFNCIIDTKAMKFDRFNLLPYEKRLEKKDEKWQYSMVIDRVLAKKSGGCYIVTRRSGIETHYVADLSGKKFPKTEQVEGPIHVFEADASGDQKWYRVIDRSMVYDNAIPGNIISACFDDVLFILLNDNEANNEKRKLKQPADPVNTMKDALLIEFKADGTEKAKLILKDGFKQMGLMPSQVWRCTPGLLVTTGAEGFGKDKTWPVVISLSNEVKK